MIIRLQRPCNITFDNDIIVKNKTSNFLIVSREGRWWTADHSWLYSHIPSFIPSSHFLAITQPHWIRLHINFFFLQVSAVWEYLQVSKSNPNRSASHVAVSHHPRLHLDDFWLATVVRSSQESIGTSSTCNHPFRTWPRTSCIWSWSMWRRRHPHIFDPNNWHTSSLWRIASQFWIPVGSIARERRGNREEEFEIRHNWNRGNRSSNSSTESNANSRGQKFALSFLVRSRVVSYPEIGR